MLDGVARVRSHRIVPPKPELLFTEHDWQQVHQRLAIAGKPVEVRVMKVKREHYKSLKDLPREEYVTPGSPLCAGCGGLTTLRSDAQGAG